MTSAAPRINAAELKKHAIFRGYEPAAPPKTVTGNKALVSALTQHPQAELIYIKREAQSPVAFMLLRAILPAQP